MIKRRNWRALAGLGGAIALLPTAASAQTSSDISQQIGNLERELAAQRSVIAEQTRELAEQQQELDRLRRLVAPDDPAARAASASMPQSAPPAAPAATVAALPDRPVGEAPEMTRVAAVDAVAEGAGVLTRRGHFVLEPSLEYTNSSNNRLVFRGVELIPGLQVGQIEASDAERETIVGADTLRYGLTGNLEIEARVPVLARIDHFTATQQSRNITAQTSKLSRKGLGDIEVGLRYQLNHPLGEKPILIGTFRVKSDTGKSPFDVPFDSAGVAQGLATGSGFWAIQPGLNVLLPSDPVVIFGGASYLHQFARNIDRVVGEATIGRVDPGDAINANAGFGFALNQRFSFSLGYQHNYIFPMHWQINGAANTAEGLQVGSLALGMSYRVTEEQSVNFGVEIGATRDAPDVSLIVRLPFSPN